MPHKGPHISVAQEALAERVLGLSKTEFKGLPESVRTLAGQMAEELFLIRYNPFIDPGMVLVSVRGRLAAEGRSLSKDYSQMLSRSIRDFWKRFEDDQAFKDSVLKRLSEHVAKENIDLKPSSLVENSTDATDLRIELPMFIVNPSTIAEIKAVVTLAGEMGFTLTPRGGGSGLTGGAVPASARTVMLSLSKLKRIGPVDATGRTLCAEAGVITADAIAAAAAHGLLFTVDPASKTASSIGGNISENSGGPFAFEYGTTLDAILSYTMVLPSGEFIEVKRRDHPFHKILPDETAVFDVYNERGSVVETISLPGSQIRAEGLGKDVTNKHLGGLPGVQKEGVDGVIVEGCFILHEKPKHSRTLCLEFFGRSMKNAMYVIKDIVAMRDQIRAEGDKVKISALEEFGTKYVAAIEYRKKSEVYEGDPISVLLVQFDSDDETALDAAVREAAGKAEPYHNVDAFIAKDAKQAELYWEDRHKLSAISKRTSGFKINEDVVIPLEVIPEFADFLEDLNLVYMAKAYRQALRKAAELSDAAADDEFIEMEREFTSQIVKGKLGSKDLTDQELEMQAFYFFFDLKTRHPKLVEELSEIHKNMIATRVVVANHMHAGDGNCHVNIPVNSNDPEMMRLAEEAAESVMKRVLELKGEVSGEHGIGVTKISFLSDEKIAALKEYKRRVDPKGVFNPFKLTQRKLPTQPYTFSFNRLIGDIRTSGLPEKERLINLLQNIQVCTRCGKCKQVCPMYFPQQGLLQHPRNKNISLGALIEALYYSQVNTGKQDPKLLNELRRLVEHCTGCGKCTSVCPVKIKTSEVTLHLRAYLEDKGAGGHPLKSRVLNYLAAAPAVRVPKAAKIAAAGQGIANKILQHVPESWRDRFASPALNAPGPLMGLKNVYGGLQLERGSILVPIREGDSSTDREAVVYFPGCGGGLFFRSIAMAGTMLLLEAGYAVILPKDHMCCGYPLLVSGLEEAFHTNQARNVYGLKKLMDDARAEGLHTTSLLTACGSCREGLQHYELDALLKDKLKHGDVVQWIHEMKDLWKDRTGLCADKLIYHAACHAEWTGVSGPKAAKAYMQALETTTGASVHLSPGCCGESGLGALTSPDIYNRLRMRKMERLSQDVKGADPFVPVVVGCPSCKGGIMRSFLQMGEDRAVVHTLEYLAAMKFGPKWEKRLKKATAAAKQKGHNVRLVSLPF